MQGFNIFFRKDGRFEERIHILKNEKGNRHFNHFFIRTKEQVCEKMAAFRNADVKSVINDMSLSNLYTEWYHFPAQE